MHEPHELLQFTGRALAIIDKEGLEKCKFNFSVLEERRIRRSN